VNQSLKGADKEKLRSAAGGDGWGGGGDVDRGAEDGEEAGGLGGVAVVEEEVLGDSEGGVGGDEGDGEGEGGDEEGAEGGEEEEEEGRAGEERERLEIREGAAEEAEGAVAGAEEVEEEPGSEEGEEEHQGEGACEERHRQDQRNHDVVVHAEVRDVVAHAHRRLRE